MKNTKKKKLTSQGKSNSFRRRTKAQKRGVKRKYRGQGR